MVATLAPTTASAHLKRGPKLKPIKRSETINFRVEPAIKDALDSLPAREKRGFIRRALLKALRRRGFLDQSAPLQS